MDVIKRVSGIDEVIPRLIRMVSFEYNEVKSFEYTGSLPDNQDDVNYLYESLNFELAEGKFLKADDRGKVLLGSDFVETRKFGKNLRVGSKVLIQGKEFEVQGFLKKAGSFQLNSVVFMTEDDIKNVLKIGDEIDLIVVQVIDKDRVDKVAEDLKRELMRDRNQKLGEEDFSVETPLQTLGSVNLILNIINIIVSGIAAISLLVGGLGIANSMFTSVLERKREIGVMKAVGAKNADILIVFLIESGLIGLVGGLIGVLLGLSFAFAVSFIANSSFGSEIISVTISYPLIFAALAFSFFIGVLFGVIPALQASKLKPVEALRG
ncbi:MAG: ABC transporter permease [Nanoarchaeota archaeon]|nr:ABC transporter permease [Nanoarchaeota archaeon]